MLSTYENMWINYSSSSFFPVPAPLMFIIFWLCQSVGMRPLERSLEKLDDVRRKKLSEMIASSGGGESAGTGSGLRTSILHSRDAEHQVLFAGFSLF